MKSKEQKLTQLSAKDVNVDMAIEVFGNYAREGAGELIRTLERDAYVLDETIGGSHNLYPISQSLIGDNSEFPNVIHLIEDASVSEDCLCDAVVAQNEFEVPMRLIELDKAIKGGDAHLVVVNAGEDLRLFQRFEHGKSYIPRFFQQVIGRHGEMEYRIARSIMAVDSDGDHFWGLVTLEDVLSIYGVANPTEYTNKDTSFSDRLLKAWVTTFQEKYEKMPSSIQMLFFDLGAIKAAASCRNAFSGFLLDVIVNPKCDEIYQLVELYYRRNAAAPSKKEVEPAASGTSSSLELEDVQAVLCTLESVDHTDSIPALNRPRYIGWFKTIQDAVDFVTYELDNSPMYKNVESVEKKILENGDIEVTINSVVKLVYHFELIQK